MKKRHIILFLTIFCVPLFAQEKTHHQQVSIQPVAEEYVKLYTSTEFDKYAAFYTDDSIFEDPTTEIFSHEKNHAAPVGKQAIMEFLKKGFKGIFDGQYIVEKKFFAGEYAVFHGVYHYKTRGERFGLEKPHLQFDLPLVIILKIHAGKVLHHQDYADYSKWFEQYNAQK